MSMSRRRALTFLALVPLSGCAARTATSGRVVIRDDQGAVDLRINDHDRELIRSYYGGQHGRGRGLPPGLAKREQLPPGLAKRDTLPAGLRGEPLPSDLERSLARLPESHVRLRIGRDIVLMNSRTRVVFDIVYGIVH